MGKITALSPFAFLVAVPERWRQRMKKFLLISWLWWLNLN